MEKHKCKLCLRSFGNGRALGGHVRSHMMNLYPPPKFKLLQEESSEEEIESLQSSSSFTSSEDEDEDEWRENSQNYSLLVDHEFNLAVKQPVLQERESESESSRNLFGKRIRSSRISSAKQFCNMKDSIFRHPNCEKVGKNPVESQVMEGDQPLSSISETTPEEDIAYCLMMLSRDKWIKTEPIEKSEEENWQQEQESEEEKNHTKDDFQDSGVVAKVRKSRSRGGKYRCETCDRVFRSYQALGGHRASHKRIKLSNFSSTENKLVAGNAGNFEEQKIHECPVCFKVFSSGQALGGHKRSHGATSLNLSSSGKTFSKSGIGKALIDLNLPAPIDDEDDNISQVEVEQFSAVSDDEFVNPIK